MSWRMHIGYIAINICIRKYGGCFSKFYRFNKYPDHGLVFNGIYSVVYCFISNNFPYVVFDVM